MKSISFWGRDHKIVARIIIAVCYLILNISGLFLGDLIYSVSGAFNIALILIPVMMIIAGYIFYPNKKAKDSYRNFYFFQKTTDLVLITGTFLFVVFAGNAVNRNYEWATPVSAAQTIRHADNNHFAGKEKKISTHPKVSKKTIRQQLKALRNAYKSANGSNKTLLIIAVVLGACVLFFFLAALSCNISCSGNEGLAITVLVLGIAAIAYGATKIIQRITRGPKAKKEKPTEAENKPAQGPVVQ